METSFNRNIDTIFNQGFNNLYPKHKLILFSLTLQNLILQIEASGGQAFAFGCDVSKEADVESMIKTVRH